MEKDVEDWVLRVLAQASASGMHGSITFHMREGRIQQAEVRSNERPPGLDKANSPG